MSAGCEDMFFLKNLKDKVMFFSNVTRLKILSCERYKFRQTIKLVYNHSYKNYIIAYYSGRLIYLMRNSVFFIVHAPISL